MLRVGDKARDERGRQARGNVREDVEDEVQGADAGAKCNVREDVEDEVQGTDAGAKSSGVYATSWS